MIVQITLGASAIAFLVLFILYASLNAEARSCRLTYSDDAVISEAQMRKWAADASWTLTHPTWIEEARTCVCDADRDPSHAPGTRKTPTWIAPGDVLSLYPDATFPTGFRRVATSAQAYASTEHVKVCLESVQLAQLWNGVDWQFDRPEALP